jgi:dihydroorotase
MTQPFSKRESSSYIVENIELWTAEGVRKNQQIAVEKGELKAIGEGLKGGDRIDGQGKALMPAGVDAQAHLRVPGQAQKELPKTGLLAALRGGYSALLTMPNTQPTIDSVEVLKNGQDQVLPFEKEFGVHVFWSASITRRLNSEEPVDYADLVRAGVRAFTNDGLGVNSDAVMEQAFAKIEKLGVPLLQHAEFLGHGGTMAPGPIQQKVKAAPYPDEPEWRMVERDIRELKKHPGARYHVLHVSSRRTLDFVRQARAQGLQVTAEVSPHHLYFNTETIDPDNTSFKMNPPIRSREDQQALWRALAEGEIDFVATDHAPHEPTMKKGHFDKVAFGTIGLETTLPVLIDAWKKGTLTAERLVEVFSTKPAAFLRLPRGFGEFVTGAAFHAVWFDPRAAAHVYTENDFSSLSKNSCFLGASLPGKILGAFHERGIFNFT